MKSVRFRGVLPNRFSLYTITKEVLALEMSLLFKSELFMSPLLIITDDLREQLDE